METKPLYCPSCGIAGVLNNAPLYAGSYVPPGEVWFISGLPFKCDHVEAIIANIQQEGGE